MLSSRASCVQFVTRFMTSRHLKGLCSTGIPQIGPRRIFRHIDVVLYSQACVRYTDKDTCRAGYFRKLSSRSGRHDLIFTLPHRSPREHKTWPYISLIAIGGLVVGLTYSQLHYTDVECVASTHISTNPGTATANDTTEENEKESNHFSINEAKFVSRDLLQRVKDETGTPGISISVSINGKTVWSEGIGYADVENRVPCKGETVMRIASISKSITMAAVAKLWENKMLDLDKPIQDYIKNWPEKNHGGNKVTITTRQLVSHLAGIRHYDKLCGRKEPTKNNNEETKDALNESLVKQKDESKALSRNEPPKTTAKSEFDQKEYYIKDHYANINEALKMFKGDTLCSIPGTSFLYTTHGWTLVSAVVERASGHKFPKLITQLFKDLGMQETYLDENDPIIYNRARFYEKNKRGRVVNAPYVDNSYKWAGGGFLSTAANVVAFGNAMLYSYQWRPQGNGHSNPPGYIKAETMQKIWTPVEKTKCSWDSDGFYGMGWAVVPYSYNHGHCKKTRFYVGHTGGAVGASSVLLVLPKAQTAEPSDKSAVPPQGVVVAILANLTAVSLNKTALAIAKLFENADIEP